MPKLLLVDIEANPASATVDDITLERGGEAQSVTEEQARRLRDAGLRLAEPGANPYEAQTVDELRALADDRGLDVQGSGSGGSVLKADLIDALTTDDEQGD